MSATAPHISVCVCTFKRPQFLGRLLAELERQQTGGMFTYSVVVCDNDFLQSARAVVEEFSSKSALPVAYCVEAEQNIARARNKALENASGDLVAFIDDDEFPPEDWLRNLFTTCEDCRVDGVLGPVNPHFEDQPPEWVLKGRFYERPSHETGRVLRWHETRTGNVLMRRHIFTEPDAVFAHQFGMGGEDRDFFRRMIEKGFRFVWCAEAPVYETVPAQRCKRSFMLKRALVRGKIPHFSSMDIVKSLIAVPLYSMVLPFLFVAGHHRFMRYLIKDFDHIGRLLAFCGIDVVREKYVLE